MHYLNKEIKSYFLEKRLYSSEILSELLPKNTSINSPSLNSLKSLSASIKSTPQMSMTVFPSAGWIKYIKKSFKVSMKWTKKASCTFSMAKKPTTEYTIKSTESSSIRFWTKFNQTVNHHSMNFSHWNSLMESATRWDFSQQLLKTNKNSSLSSNKLSQRHQDSSTHLWKHTLRKVSSTISICLESKKFLNQFPISTSNWLFCMPCPRKNWTSKRSPTLIWQKTLK